MPARAYLRLDPHVYDRKVLGVDADGVPLDGWQPYPRDALVAFFGALALADMQPERGTFRSERLLRELLRGAAGLGAKYARQVPTLIERGDLTLRSGGRLYVDGWNEWQEGDLTVHERMRRYRAKQRNGVTAPVTASVTPDVTEPVTPRPSDGDRRARDARGRSAEALSRGISTSRGGGPSRPRPMDDDQRRQMIGVNRQLIESRETGTDARRAALRTLHRLDPETDWQAISDAAVAHPNGDEAPARPRRADSA